MAYATEGKMATSRRHSIPTHNTTWLLTRRSSGNSLKNHLQPHGECQDDQSGGSRRSRVDEGDNTLTYIAQFNYVAQKSIDLSFSKGEILQITDRSDAGWWYARSLDNRREGYIPSNYVTRLEDNTSPMPSPSSSSSPSQQKWFFEITRSEAEKLLWQNNKKRGTFLIRKNEGGGDPYTLSVRDDTTVRHYYISKLGTEYYISQRVTFKTLEDLVKHYSQEANKLCCRLTTACPRTEASVTSTMDKWEIDGTAIKFVRKLSSSKAVEIWEGDWNHTIPVAVKMVPKPPTEVATEDFLTEAHMLAKLRDENIIQLYAICSKCQPAYIIIEFMNKGNLLDYLKTREGQKMTVSTLMEIAIQVASGMFYLETNNYIHRDLRARNILVGEGNQAKIASLGKAKELQIDKVYHTVPRYKVPKSEDLSLSIRWTAPEVFIHLHHTIKSDVWSFGILLTELFTRGCEPFPGMTNSEVTERVKMGYHMPQPAECPDTLYQIMLNCWKYAPSERPTFDYLHHLDDYVTEADHVHLHQF